MNSQRLLVWLPSPLGDAIMATPALRAFRSNLPHASITFSAPTFTRQVLSPGPFCDAWLEPGRSFAEHVGRLKSGAFDSVILLKNSFGSALTARLAGIPRRIGYARDMRSVLLTDRVPPVRDEKGRFKPLPMIDYYLAIASFLGMNIDSRKTELSFTPDQREAMLARLPQLKDAARPLVILVPGGAFGPSKLWPNGRYAELADRLNQTCGATVLLSVAPVPKEIEIAEDIRSKAKSPVINLGLTPLNGGCLKALFGSADLVISNDTGPRHIAIALDKPVVSLFGPNNPRWTQSGHDKEIQIIGKAPCVPCDRPVCKQNQHLCMESITVEQVLDKTATLLKV